MKYLSICSGIEAATTAWHPLGWKPLAFSEIEKFPSALLAHHWPDVPNLGDMTKHHEWPTTLQPDIIVGGCPCQAFSVAGLREGLNDPRGNLTLTFLSIIEQYRPRWVVYENVPGILSDKTGAFGSLLGGLGELGYGFAYRVLDAQYFGVAQRRRRVFVVACLGDWQRAAAVLFESHSLQGHNPPSREAGKGTATGFETGPCGNRFIDTAPTLDTKCKDGPIRNQIGAGVMQVTGLRMTAFGEYVEDETASTMKLRDYKDATELVVQSQYGEIAGSLTARHDSSPCADRGQNVVAVGAFKGPQGSGHDESGVMYTLTKTDVHAVAYGFNGDQSEKTRSMGEREEQSPTLRADGPAHVAYGIYEEQNAAEELMGCLKARTAGGGFEGSIMQPNLQVRRLTPVECHRLQGFPDNHCNIPWNGWRAMDADETPEQCIADGLEVRQNKKTGKWRVKDVDGPKYKALGNSMAVPVMRWIGERINLFH